MGHRTLPRDDGPDVLTLLGMTLGLTVNRKWFVVPFVVQTFFLQHALQAGARRCRVLRRLGVRTQAEIDEERRYALKALRGDFRELSQGLGRADEAIAAARRVYALRRGCFAGQAFPPDFVWA